MCWRFNSEQNAGTLSTYHLKIEINQEAIQINSNIMWKDEKGNNAIKENNWSKNGGNDICTVVWKPKRKVSGRQEGKTHSKEKVWWA